MKYSAILFFMVLTIFLSCNLNVVPEQINYERIRGETSWGFIDNNGDTIVPLDKYEFLNPIDEQGMILAKKNEKWGYIDINQNILIDFKYEDLSVFTEGLSPAKLGGKYGYINRKGEVVIPFQYDSETYFYSCGLAKVKLNDRYGFIDKSGKVVVPIEYEKVDYNKNDSLVLVFKNKKWAFFDNTGKQLSDFEFDEILESMDQDNRTTFMGNGLILTKRNGLFGYLDHNLNKVIDYGQYRFAEPINKYGLAIVGNEEVCGIINYKGNVVLPLEYPSIEHPKKTYGGNHDEFIIKKDGKYGLMNEYAELVAEIVFDDFILDNWKRNGTKEKIFHAKKDGKYGIINKRGEKMIPFKYDKINKFIGDSITDAKHAGKSGLIKSNGDIVLPFEYASIYTDRFWDFYIIRDEKFCGLLDKRNRDTIIPFQYEDITPCYYDYNNKYIVRKNGYYGIINDSLEIIIPLEYDNISNWVEYGPDAHIVVKNSKYGLISREGKVIIPTDYEQMYIDGEFPLIKVGNNSLWGTVNWKNEIVHPIKYEQVLWDWTFLATDKVDTVYVKKNGKYYATDLNGNVVDSNVSDELIEEKFGYLFRDYDDIEMIESNIPKDNFNDIDF